MLPSVCKISIATGGSAMKGYITAGGYMGWVDGRYILFASEEDYLEYLED